MLEPWEHVTLWAPLSPLELPHGYVGGNAPLWDGARKVGEGQVVVLGRDGIGWLRVEKIRPVFGAPPFVGPQYGHKGAAGDGCWRALKISVAATAAFSAEDQNKIVELCGKNSTVSS